ncbi:MAG: dihydrodipicolinate synthase family protein [Gemmatimonadota bacterium]|nr:dihydrodipicolinate synthase family protein [Gemmatimonadota bacterium]
MSLPLAGLFCPVPTPFSDSGDAEPERLGAQLRIYGELGLAGVVLFGTSGEGPLLDDDEEAALLDAAVEAAPPEWTVIAQTGRESVRAARVAARRAESAGVDALLCLPPFYYPYGHDELAEYYRAVREASPLPLLAYHIPQRTGVDLTADLLSGLADEGVLDGIKDSAGDLALQEALRDRAGSAFSILSGSARATAAAIAAGADGAILAVADAAPEVAAELVDAALSGRAERADELRRSLAPLADAFGSRWGVPAIKAALDLRGWPGGGSPRPPLQPLGPEGREAVADALREAGVDLS